MLWLKGQATLPILGLARCHGDAQQPGPQLEGKHQAESDAAAMFGYWPLPRQSPKCGPSRGTRCELYGIGATDLPE